jgi:hypothetical protein
MGVQQRANAVRILGDGAPMLRQQPRLVRTKYALSLIVCDSSGHFALWEVEQALKDPRLVALAEVLLREAGAW